MDVPQCRPRPDLAARRARACGCDWASSRRCRKLESVQSGPLSSGANKGWGAPAQQHVVLIGVPPPAPAVVPAPQPLWLPLLVEQAAVELPVLAIRVAIQRRTRPDERHRQFTAWSSATLASARARPAATRESAAGPVARVVLVALEPTVVGPGAGVKYARVLIVDCRVGHAAKDAAAVRESGRARKDECEGGGKARRWNRGCALQWNQPAERERGRWDSACQGDAERTGERRQEWESDARRAAGLVAGSAAANGSGERARPRDHRGAPQAWADRRMQTLALQDNNKDYCTVCGNGEAHTARPQEDVGTCMLRSISSSTR